MENDLLLGAESTPEFGEIEEEYYDDEYDDDDEISEPDSTGSAGAAPEDIVKDIKAEVKQEPGPSQAQPRVDSGRREWESKAHKGEEAGLKNFDPGAKVYFAVDDYDDSNVQQDSNDLHTTLFHSYAPLSPFDYPYEQDKYDYEQQLDIVDRITEMIRKSPGSKKEIRFEPSKYPDDHFHSMLQARFGTLDRKGEPYRVLFENFKCDVLEEYEFQIGEANKILRSCPFTDKDSLVDAVRSKMMPQKSRLFTTSNDHRERQSCNPYESGMEPFKVPRLPVTQFIKPDLKKEMETKREIKMRTIVKDRKLSSDDYIALNRRDVNFAVVEASMSNLKYVEYYKVHHPLVSTLLQIIFQYPLGLTPSYLYKEFERIHKYKIDYIGLGFQTFEQLLSKNSRVFTVLHGELLTLVFPAWREKLLGVDAIQRNIYHCVLILMKLLGYEKSIPVEDVAVHVLNIFGIRLNIRAWGHESDALYYRVLLQSFDSGRIQVVQSNDAPANSKDARFVLEYLKPEQPTTLELLQEEYQIDFSETTWKEPEESKSKAIKNKGEASQSAEADDDDDNGDWFAPQGTVIPSVGYYVRKGHHYEVLPELMVTPAHFFVSLAENWLEREEFFEFMTMTYNDWLTDSAVAAKFCVSAEDAQINSYVVIYFEGDWVRGRIVEILDDGLFKIVAVDVGLYDRRVKLEQLKYLHKYFMDYPEQTFLCSFRSKLIKDAYGDIDLDGFPKKTLRRFYDLLKFKSLYITPVNKIEEIDTWEVDSFQVETTNESDKKIVIPDLAACLAALDDPDFSIVDNCTSTDSNLTQT